MRVLRVTSVFEPPLGAWLGTGAALDPVGGMQTHTGALTRVLDASGVRQDVVSAHRPGAGARERFGEHSTVWRIGVPIRAARQLWAPGAAALSLALARRADLVHAHAGEDVAALPIALAAARAAGVPLVVTLHTSLAHTAVADPVGRRLVHRLGACAERRVVRVADAVVVLTERMRALLLAGGVDAARVQVVPSGIAYATFSGAFDDPLPRLARPRVVFVGRLVPQKDPLTVVELAARLSSRARVVMIGDGPQRALVERRVADLRLHGRVVVTGFVSAAEVAAHLAHADVMVLPSRYEELGTAVLEAMALGVPVVASRTGGLPDVVDDGRTGLLVEPGDAPAFARAVDALVADPARRHAMAGAARRRARGYDWDRLAQRVLATYRLVAPRETIRLAPATAGAA
ncbi:MAG TPA: glycosyltransferase family 4 protein [Solirubrobacteraceae bacterium]|nr:glycosyltransferase family 4 protein [Solirubrobacteraceae bacterium]